MANTPQSLKELCSRVIGQTYPFELVQQRQPRLPDELQKRIAFWSFPQSERRVLDHASVVMGMSDYDIRDIDRLEATEMVQVGKRVYTFQSQTWGQVKRTEQPRLNMFAFEAS